MKAPSVYCFHIDDKPRLSARVRELRDHVDFFAVGIDLHMEEPSVLREIRHDGLRAYAHFLYYDIQEVVVQAAETLIGRGYDAIDLHALCGQETIAATCEVVHKASANALVIACALLPSQLELPWWSRPATLEEAGLFAAAKARQALQAGADGVLSPREIAEFVAEEVPANKALLVYADPGTIHGWPADWGAFYDCHWDETWQRDEGIRLIQARRQSP